MLKSGVGDIRITQLMLLKVSYGDSSNDRMIEPMPTIWKVLSLVPRKHHLNIYPMY